MGLFSEKCTQCGRGIKKGADYCSSCSQPRKGAWRTCHSCGSSVGAQSSACWKCRADLTAQATDQLFDDRWRRSATNFAVRFPLRVSAGIVKHGIQVDEGTRAFLYVNGKSDGFLKPGYHVKSSLLERLTKLEKHSDHSYAILASTGPVMVSFPIAGLYDAEQIPLGAIIKLELELKDPDKFNERAMVGRETFGSSDLAALVGEEVKDVVQKQAASYRVEDLLGDLSQREGLEAALGLAMARILAPYGMRFNSVRLARFTGEEVESVRQRMGDRAVKARQWELDRELQNLDRENSLSAIQTEYDYNEREKQLAAEYALKDEERDLFRKRWTAQSGHEFDLEELARNKEARLAHQEAAREVRTGEKCGELSELDHEAAKAGKKSTIAQIEKRGEAEVNLTEAEGEAAVSDVKHSQTVREDRRDIELANEVREQALKAKRLQNEIEIERQRAEAQNRIFEENQRAEIELKKEEARARTLSGKSKEELIAITGRADLADRFVRLEQVQRGMEPKFAPGPHNQEFTGLTPQGGAVPTAPYGAPYGNPHLSAGAHVPGVAPALTYPQGFGGYQAKISDAARRMMPAVGLISAVAESGKAQGFGTGWLLSSTILATNAHVAEEAIKALKAGASCWVTFGGDRVRKTRVKRAVMHPRYGQDTVAPDGSKPAVPAYDVAILILEDEQPVHFQMASVDKLSRFVSDQVGMEVAYIGFPMEGMAGGGVNLMNPAALMKKGTVIQVTDWWLGGAVDFGKAQLIQHDMGVAGGASGSPLFDADGDVVGIVSAGNMAGGMDPKSGAPERVPSGVMVNFAQRVDLLGDLLASSQHEQY